MSCRCGGGRGLRLDVAGTDQQVKLLFGHIRPVASCGLELPNAVL